MILTTTNLAQYLRERGVAPDASVEVAELGGGVSNTVLCARWPGGAVVVKQSLEKLRVAADWSFDPARILIERDCLDTLAALMPGAAPTVVFCDEPQYVLGMSLAPEGGSVWRDQLTGGHIDYPTVERAAELLGRLQAATEGSAALARRFDDQMPLIEGRVDPFHREVAQRHPDLAGLIEEEVVRLLESRSVLVHGDYSPKNVISYPDSILLLDCEVAHWGDPAFDPAFLLCHLLLDGGHRPELAKQYAAAGQYAWRVFCAAGGRAADERTVILELGCILLARVDGKSPLPNLQGDRPEAVRLYGRHLLRLRAEASVEDALADSVHFLGNDDEGGRQCRSASPTFAP